MTEVSPLTVAVIRIRSASLSLKGGPGPGQRTPGHDREPMAAVAGRAPDVVDRRRGGLHLHAEQLLDGLANLPPSVYLVQIILADQVFVKKVFSNR